MKYSTMILLLLLFGTIAYNNAQTEGEFLALQTIKDVNVIICVSYSSSSSVCHSV